MSSIKWMIFSCLLIFIALASTNAEGNNFDRLEEYLKNYEQLDDAGLIKLAESAADTGDNRVRRAAEILVYLYELKNCTRRALDYMWYVLIDRPNAEPGWQVQTEAGFIKKRRLDKLLEASLMRASEKCKSYINSWHDQREQAIDPATKHKLYNLIPHEARAKALVQEGERYFIEMLVKVARNDATVSKKLAKLQTEQQLYQFYRAYLEDSFIKPCRKYVEAMGGVISRGERFGLEYSRHAKLFDKPSESYLDSSFRYEYCQHPSPTLLKRIAKEAARYAGP